MLIYGPFDLFIFIVVLLCRFMHCTDNICRNYKHLSLLNICLDLNTLQSSGHHGRDRMVAGFTTTYAISAYYH